MEWRDWIVGGTALSAAARVIWAHLRGTPVLRPRVLERLYGVATSSTLLLFCRMENRQDKAVILALLDLMEKGGIAPDEIREYRRKFGSGSAGGTGSPFEFWIGGESTSTPASPTTPPSSPSSDPTAPGRSKKNP